MSIDAVPLIDLSRTHAPLLDALQAAFSRVLQANSYILGPEVTRFEVACAETLGVRHAIGVSSGSDALLLALMALGIGPGDEVICPSYTFFATAGAIWRLGATPVFADCDPQHWLIDLEHAARLVTARTRALIPVYLFGQCAPLEPLRAFCQAHGLALIEDAAQAIGAAWNGQPAGSVGEFGCFSFFPSKNLGGFGDGGLLTTQDSALAEKATVLRAHGAKPKYYHHLVGGNFRLDALQAALLAVKLPHTAEYARCRQARARRYSAALTDTPIFQWPFAATAASEHVFNQYIITLPDQARRDHLQQFLTERRIGTAIYYPVPLHLQDCFSTLGYQPGDLPVSERAALTTLALPIFPELSDAEQAYVLEALLNWAAQA